MQTLRPFLMRSQNQLNSKNLTKEVSNVGNPLKMIEPELREKMEILNIEGAKIAKGVCPAGKFVAGDTGPTGKMLKPIGDLSPEDAAASFFQQASTLMR
jgi:5-methyltetrahydrofolate--homocysteine methyltransferase